jgi:hypothetical protein
LEENGCGYSQHCALNHAVLANTYRKRGEFIRGNSITNALQAYNEIEQYSQGMLTFLPNGSFAQPTFHVNAMFAKHCSGTQELNISVVGGVTSGKLLLDAGVGIIATEGAAAGRSAAEMYVIRLAHFGTHPMNVTFEILGQSLASAGIVNRSIMAERITLAGGMDEVNVPGDRAAPPSLLLSPRHVSQLIRRGLVGAPVMQVFKASRRCKMRWRWMY